MAEFRFFYSELLKDTFVKDTSSLATPGNKNMVTVDKHVCGNMVGAATHRIFLRDKHVVLYPSRSEP